METYAKVICDSVSPLGVRLTSVELQFPRFVLSQLLMHRQWSRSCESLRARPTLSKVAEVESSPVHPTFAKNRKGMVAGERFDPEHQVYLASKWLEARDKVVEIAKDLQANGVAKQWANRLLEPFAYQKMIVTATDFANFLRLRCADDAQPEIQEVAVKLREALEKSRPTKVGRGDWHLPYVDADDAIRIDWPRIDEWEKVSMARCARVSYTTHDGKRDTDADYRLAETLIKSGHSNPAEHVCTPAPDTRRYANLKGWVSYRYELEQRGQLPDAEG